MPWAGGTYTKGNNGTGGWTGDATLGIGIEAGRHDTQDNDFATGINNCLTKDGTNSATADLNLGGFKPINIAAGTAAAPAICVGNDTNTGIFAKAADVIGWATNGIERMNLDTIGNLIVRTADVNPGVLQLENWGNSANGRWLQFLKSRGGAFDTNTIVQNNDAVGAISWVAANGSGYNGVASITAFIDGTPGAANDMPGRLVFSTTADGAGTPTERMRINSLGRLLINRTTEIGQSERILIGPSTGQNWATVDGGNTNAADGSAFVVATAGVTRAAFGVYSGIIGGAYDSTATLYSSGAGYKVINIQPGVGTWPMKYNPTTGAWTYDTSRRSAKENIRTSAYGLEAVKQLQPRQFNYLASEQFREDVGFIADEVHTVIPELAPPDEAGEPAGVSYDRLTAVLCKAIQELAAKVEALEALQAG